MDLRRALAICTSSGFNDCPAREIRVDFVRRALRSFLGQHPAQEIKCFEVGNTDISGPISERIAIAVIG